MCKSSKYDNEYMTEKTTCCGRLLNDDEKFFFITQGTPVAVKTFENFIFFIFLCAVVYPCVMETDYVCIDSRPIFK